MNAILHRSLAIAAVPFKAAWTAFLKSQSEVEQNKNLLWFEDYRGHPVHRRPVMSTTRPGWVESWIPDEAECREWDKVLANAAADQAKRPQGREPTLPQTTAGSASLSLNPAMTPGL